MQRLFLMQRPQPNNNSNLVTLSFNQFSNTPYFLDFLPPQDIRQLAATNHSYTRFSLFSYRKKDDKGNWIHPDPQKLVLEIRAAMQQLREQDILNYQAIFCHTPQQPQNVEYISAPRPIAALAAAYEIKSSSAEYSSSQESKCTALPPQVAPLPSIQILKNSIAAAMIQKINESKDYKKEEQCNRIKYACTSAVCGTFAGAAAGTIAVPVSGLVGGISCVPVAFLGVIIATAVVFPFTCCTGCGPVKTLLNAVDFTCEAAHTSCCFFKDTISCVVTTPYKWATSIGSGICCIAYGVSAYFDYDKAPGKNPCFPMSGTEPNTQILAKLGNLFSQLECVIQLKKLDENSLLQLVFEKEKEEHVIDIRPA